MASQVETPVKQAASPGCLTDNLGWLLGQAEHVLAAEMSARLEPLGLSSRRYCVLASAMTGDHTQIELANLIGLDKTTMVVTLDGLEADGLAKRMPSSRDRRVRVVKVTEAGERRVAKARKVIEATQKEMLERLPAAERSALLSGLTRLVCGARDTNGSVP